jgi:hypothetical protein
LKTLQIIDHCTFSWAVPKDTDENPDLNNQMEAEILVDYVETELLPVLKQKKISLKEFKSICHF